MRSSQISGRYARALYSFAKDSNEADQVFEQMRVLGEVLAQDSHAQDFLASPMIRPADKIKVVEALVKAVGFAEPLEKFMLLLAKKNRLNLFADVLIAYQTIADEAHGVTRGVVRSATVLGPEERQRITELVSRATKKQVILTYKEDPSLLGGLVAEVGSFTFDDSLLSHLTRINEQLTRSVH